jgi:hypothetical protein
MKLKDAKVGMIVKSNRNFETSDDRYMIGEIIKINTSMLHCVKIKLIENHNSKGTKDMNEGNFDWNVDYLDITFQTEERE